MKIALATCVAQRDLERLSIQRYSIGEFWPNVTHYLIVENEATFNACHHYPNTVVMPENCILNLDDVYCKWHRQQLLKMEVTRQLKADFVLWLGCDTLLIRPVDEGQLVNEGKACVGWDNIWAPDWIDAVQTVLGFRLKRQPQVVAPLLSPIIMRSLLEKIQNRHCVEWSKYLKGLSNNRILWTEYALYYAHAKQSGLFDSYHYSGLNRNIAQGYNLSSRSFDEYEFKDGLFAVIESNTKVEPANVLALFHRWLLSEMWKEKMLLPTG